MNHRLLRAGMWFLTFVEVTVGLVATLAPRFFYDNAPWVDLAPPFAEHLMRDYGAMNLALGLVTAVAAVTMSTVMVRTALVAYLLFAVPHLLFHVTHQHHHTTSQAAGETTGLTLAVLLPLALLALSWRSGSPSHRDCPAVSR
jgi:Ca2+/Na+ antiporter